MAFIIASKRVSYGTVEIIDNQGTWARYSIRVNGTTKEVSDDLNFIKQTFNNKYY